MRAALAIAGRDIRATFGTAFGYGLVAGYLVVSGLLLVLALRAGEARLDGWFAPLYLVTAVLSALLTMRSYADEERTGSLELLLTAPVRPVQVAIGKVLAATAVLTIIGASTISAPLVVAVLGDPDPGPIITGYVGLLLLGALCCAVGVAASAATGDQLAAAAIAGGLLLGLWFAASVSSVVPGTFGATLDAASPSSHITGFLRGTISVVDVVSFISVALGAVLVAAVIARARRGHARRRAAALLVAVLVVVVGVNVVASRSTAQADLSASRTFTLSSETRELVRSVAAPMKITAFLFEQGGEARDARFLLERYHELNDRIDYTVVDPDEKPAETRRFNVSGYSTVIVEYQGRRADSPDVSEGQVSSAILRALRGTTYTACSLTGHGESAFDDTSGHGLSTLRDLLTTNGYAIKPVDLTSGSPLASGCDVVLVLGPTVALSVTEVAALTDYGKRDGHLLVLGDSALDTDADLNPLLEPWGISISEAVLLDPQRSVQGDPFGIVVQDFPSSSPVARGVPSIQLTVATGLLAQGDEANGLTVSKLAQTSSAGFLDADGDFAPSPPDIAGPITVAAAADASKVDGATIHRTRVVAVANSHFAENEFIDSLGNRRLIVNAMGWLTEEEQLLTVATSPPQPRELPWTDERQRVVVGITVVLVPGLVIGLGVLQWLLGRRLRPATRPARRAQDRKKRR